jgi:hypothetical protein
VIKYGKNSQAKIAELDGRLQTLLHRYSDVAPESLDISVICGHRGEAEQNAAFNARPQRSKLQWPMSAHNKQPAKAFDFNPYPFTSYNDRDAWLLRQGALRLVAAIHGIRLKPLIDWDLPHVELEA